MVREAQGNPREADAVATGGADPTHHLRPYCGGCLGISSAASWTQSVVDGCIVGFEYCFFLIKKNWKMTNMTEAWDEMTSQVQKISMQSVLINFDILTNIDCKFGLCG